MRTSISKKVPAVLSESYNKFMSRAHPLHLIGLLVCLASLAFAYFYLQQALGLEPCPLCVLDRIIFVALAIVFALAYFQQPNRRDRIGYDIGALVVTAGGLGVAGRHVHLQYFPVEGMGNCGAGFWSLLDRIGIEGAVASALQGEGDCGEIQWTFLGLSIPTLTLGIFIFLFLLALVDMIQAIRQPPMES